MTDLAARARLAATFAHAATRQTRSGSDRPYIEHVSRVAELVREHRPDDGIAEAVAWLHDVVEDTGVPLDMIFAEFGADVAADVDSLTTPDDRGDITHAAEFAARMDRATARAQSVKCADILANASDPVFDVEFARRWLAEKAGQLDVLDRADPGLRGLARDRVRSVQAEIARVTEVHDQGHVGETRPFDAADYLESSEAQLLFLQVMDGSEGGADVLDRLHTVARARAKANGTYPAAGAADDPSGPDPGPNPTCDDLIRIATALGYRLTFQRIPDAPKP